MKIWVKWLILGILSLVFGFFVLANPIAASVTVTVLAGIMFAIAGGIQIAAGIGETATGSRLMGFALGLLMLFLGASLMFRPLDGVISLAAIVTIIFAASGIARLITSYQMRATVFFWPMLLSGALSVLLAGYIAVNFFEVAPSLLGILLGIELLFNGTGLIMLAFFLRTARNQLMK
jgi:membrane protein HdeD